MASINESIFTFAINFILNTDTKTLTFEDLIADDYNTLYGLTLSNVKGLIKITSPSGTILYVNSGWGSNSFASPDIHGGDGTWSKDLIALALDADDNVEKGTYVFEYKVSINGTDLSYTITKQYNFQYDGATVVLDQEVSLSTSELISTDNTDYSDCLTTSVNVEPSSITRAHKIVKPEGAGCSFTASADEKVRTLGGGEDQTAWIWTGVWQIQLTSTLQYVLDTWNGENWIIVDDEVGGYDSIEVKDSQCGCNVRQCVINLIERWKDKISNDYFNAQAMQTKVLKVLSAWMNYNMAMRCGANAEAYCSEISTIVQGEDCDCSESNDDISIPIVPWEEASSSGGSDSGSNITMTALEPTGGENNDMHVQTSSWDLWYKTGGEWLNMGSIKGDTGDTGGKGDKGDTGDVIPWTISDTEPSGGSNNDFHVKTDGSTVWQLWHKETGSWVSKGSMKGGQGDTGDKGDTGDVIRWSLSANTPTGGDAGDFHVKTDGSTVFELWEKVGSTWTNRGSFKGDTGDTGSKGDTGDAGVSIKGDTGEIPVIVSDTTPTGASETPSMAGYIFIKSGTSEIWMAKGTGSTDWIKVK